AARRSKNWAGSTTPRKCIVAALKPPNAPATATPMVNCKRRSIVWGNREAGPPPAAVHLSTTCASAHQRDAIRQQCQQDLRLQTPGLRAVATLVPKRYILDSGGGPRVPPRNLTWISLVRDLTHVQDT